MPAVQPERLSFHLCLHREKWHDRVDVSTSGLDDISALAKIGSEVSILVRMPETYYRSVLHIDRRDAGRIADEEHEQDDIDAEELELAYSDTASSNEDGWYIGNYDPADSPLIDNVGLNAAISAPNDRMAVADSAVLLHDLFWGAVHPSPHPGAGDPPSLIAVRSHLAFCRVAATNDPWSTLDLGEAPSSPGQLPEYEWPSYLEGQGS